MKTISAALQTHLNGEVTTLCSCWKIVRRDGRQFFFTDHDRDIVFEGDTYEAETSYDRTAIESRGDFAVNEMEVAGIVESTQISEEELRAGLFNRADVYVFILNWKDTSQGALKVRRGWFGEVTLTQNGQFKTEIRGLADALSHNLVEVYTPECRADFGDSRCKISLANYRRRASVTNKGDGFSTFTGSDIPAAPTTGTSVGAHRYWSIKPTAYTAGSKFWISEVRFRDQSGNLVTGGTAKDNIPGSKFNPKPKNLRDGDFKSMWGFDAVWNTLNGENDEDIDITSVRWWIDFGVAVDISQVELIYGSMIGEAITAFDLQWRDAEPVNGSQWNTAKSFAHVPTAAYQSALFSLGSTGQGPINFPASQQNVPAPATGASTYVGGTIEWLSGKNRGRVCEILGFNTGTNTVTLFEAMPYTIEVGDLFHITQGCDRTLAACKLYNNVINRRAEDFVPGQDELMDYKTGAG